MVHSTEQFLSGGQCKVTSSPRNNSLPDIAHCTLGELVKSQTLHTAHWVN